MTVENIEGSAYSLPGEELGGEVVEPIVTELPSPVKETHESVAEEKDRESSQNSAACNEVSSVNDEAIQWLNHFDLNEGETSPVSLQGEEIISMAQMSVSTNYGTVFNRLIHAELDSGVDVWFGYDNNLNNDEARARIGYDSSGDQPLFGATTETLKHFSWGNAKSGSALLKESQELVTQYKHCFE